MGTVAKTNMVVEKKDCISTKIYEEGDALDIMMNCPNGEFRIVSGILKGSTKGGKSILLGNEGQEDIKVSRLRIMEMRKHGDTTRFTKGIGYLNKDRGNAKDMVALGEEFRAFRYIKEYNYFGMTSGTLLAINVAKNYLIMRSHHGDGEGIIKVMLKDIKLVERI